MSTCDDEMAVETGRALITLYRAGIQVQIRPDTRSGQASARIVPGPTAKPRVATAVRSATGSGDSPLAALYAAVDRMNERAGAVLVRLD